MLTTDTAHIAARLRALRVELGLSLRETASRANIAPSFLSKLEAGTASPTIQSLIKVLEALGTDVVTFFGALSVDDDLPVVFPKKEMRSLEGKDRTFWYAFPGHRDVQLVLAYEEYQPGSKVREEEEHPVDLCGYVIDGVLTIELTGRENTVARKGDAFYIRAGQRHVSSNHGNKLLRLVVVYPK